MKTLLLRTLTSTAVVLGIVTLLTHPTLAFAKPLLVESVEWVVVDSDLVIIGKITKVETLKWKENLSYDVVTVAVDKTLVGEPTPTVTFLVSPLPKWIPRAKAWQGEAKAMLFFLVKNYIKDKTSSRSKYEYILRDG